MWAGDEVLDFMPGEVVEVDSELLTPARLRDLAGLRARRPQIEEILDR